MNDFLLPMNTHLRCNEGSTKHLPQFPLRCSLSLFALLIALLLLAGCAHPVPKPSETHLAAAEQPASFVGGPPPLSAGTMAVLSPPCPGISSSSTGAFYRRGA